jgi:hypothetical protein
MTRTLTGLYDSYDDAAAAVRDLEAAGIGDDQISLLANKAGVLGRKDVTHGNEAGVGAEAGATFGAIVGGTTSLLAGLGLLVIPGIGPVLAAGWLAATAAGAAGGALVGGAGGGLIGAMIGNGVSKEDAHVYAESVRRGGCLVTARVPNSKVATAEAILAKHRVVDPALRGKAYREAGWQGFDPNAPVNTEIEATRQREIQGPSALPPLPAETPPGRISGLAERPDADARR